MPADLRARRNALFLLFFLPGLTIASWVTRTPDVRDLVGASTAEMGLILFGLSAGSMVGILSSGALVARRGTRPVMLAGTLAVAAGAAVIGTGAALGSGPVVALGLALFGLGMGGGEIALNVEGAEVERGLGRSTMPAMHGCFSLGTVVGAVAGMVLTAVEFPVVAHLAVVAVAVVLALIPTIRVIPSGVGLRTASTAVAADAAGADVVATGTAPTGPRRPVWRDTRLLLIGGVILALAMAEGTANDWLPLVMVDGHGFDPALGSAVYAAFAAAMTLGRFVGGRFVDRFGRAAVLAVSAVVGAIGLALVIFVDHQAVAGAAAILWGLGASLGFPVALSAAGDTAAPGEDATARVSLAATIGYIAFLVGPPALGFLGDHYGLRQALVLVLVLVAAAAFLTPAARTPARVEPERAAQPA
ncbi:MFS transporter [Cellulomonas pakistanensis]|uniref:MFS transporter n=1 Tax=Cellulomonas pakistanensis TaxID=992287 RepID=A0A919P602_9CELL|nr:MFS transporter [Cellulomonas pakistanensis]GIG34905.1 MFS transporter [Cellulomonas pakistanensis]